MYQKCLLIIFKKKLVKAFDFFLKKYHLIYSQVSIQLLLSSFRMLHYLLIVLVAFVPIAFFTT